ncbi:MAG: serine hydrolase domain-containing protein [Bacteroidota bacterium]
MLKLNHLKFLIAVLLTAGFIACSKSGTPEKPSPPDTNQTIVATVSTEAATAITANSANVPGSVTNQGSASVTERGICFGLTSAPVTTGSKISSGAGAGSFSASLTGLTANTRYYVRAYAISSAGIAYGNEITFNTSATTVGTIPTVATTAATTITLTGASIGGSVTNEGSATVTERGICFATTTAPVVTGSKVTAGTGAGLFTASLAGLTSGTVYYARAYAINAAGTAYGNEVTFTTTAAAVAIASIDNAITAKLAQYSIPGVSIAIMKDEKLVYVKSYGLADKEANTTLTNDHLFRIASISKPITFIAILNLVKAGTLSLNQKVFGTGGILGNDYGTPPVGSNKDQITVQHLLDHKSGWINSPNDPMFTTNSVTQTQLITNMLANSPLATLPGATYYYSNFGYCVLGRVIEKVTGTTYENYVKTNILTPCGISQMQIGGSTLAERLPKEVKYYQTEYSPYIMNISRMDSHGGWVASATDLARLMVKIDRNGSKADIIPAALLNPTYFGYFNWYHTGSLPGTSAILSRLNNNYSFVILANTRTESNANTILDDLYNTMSTQIMAVGTWPAIDLF